MFRWKSSDAGGRAPRWRGGERPHGDADDYATILMLTALASAAGNIVTALIELGRSAGWWH